MDERGKTIGMLLVLIVAVPANAAPAHTQVTDPLAFSRIDSDHNGYVSRVEARLVAAADHFDAADANRDGLLNRDEYAQLRSRRHPHHESVR